MGTEVVIIKQLPQCEQQHVRILLSRSAGEKSGTIQMRSIDKVV